jgi:hypothetical protein
MNGIKFSKNDLYPFSGLYVDTTATTVPEESERESYYEGNGNSKTVKATDGSEKVLKSGAIWLGLGLMVLVVLLLNWMN